MFARSCAVFLTLIAAGWPLSTAAAQTPAAPPRPSMTIPHLAEPPDLKDFISMHPSGATAQAMSRVDKFITRQPTDGQPAAQDTVVYVGYTDSALHVVYVAFDPEPAKVQAHLVRREDIFSVNDDVVELRLDTFNDRRQSYYFAANPLGVQLDASWPEVGGQYDQSFDAVWHSQGQRTAEGFIVMISVPFRSLRFSPAETQTWGVYFSRWVGRSGEWSFWPAISAKQGSFLNQTASLSGIRGVSTGRNAQLIPYANYRGFKALDRRDPQLPRFVTDKLDPAVGLDAKLVVKDRFVVDVAANPDFSQVESDAPQITANQRFEVFFPEKRPFFLENAGYFQTPSTLLFTRRLADPSVGLKVTGKTAGWTVGMLAANDQAPGRRVADNDPASGVAAWAAAGRLTRDIGAQSSIGVLSTVRRLQGATNSVVSADARVRLSKTLVFTAQAAGSAISAGGSRGELFQARLANNSRTFTSQTNFVARSPEFQADLGFIPRVDVRDATHTMSYRRHRKGVLQSWGPDLSMGRTWSYVGTGLDHVVQPGVTFNLARNSTVTASFSKAAQGFRSGELRNLSSFQSFDTSTWTVTAGSLLTRWFSFNTSISGGRAVNFSPAGTAAPETGDTSAINVFVGLQPSTSVRVDTTYLRTALATRVDVRPIFTSHIVREKVSWQISREWSARAIVQYDRTTTDAALTRLQPRKNVNVDLLLTRLINPWTALYVGFNTNAQNIQLEPTATGARVALRESGLTPDARQLFVKVSYLLR